MRPLLALGLLFAVCLTAPPPRAADAVPAVPPRSAALADSNAGREQFVAALQRARSSQDAPEDSPALRSYILYDYLVAARLRYSLQTKSGEQLDSAIDAFLATRGRQPVTRALRHDWLIDLAQRRRWDWFLPRAADLTDPVLVCDRLEGRLESGDTRLGVDALTRWSLPQAQPRECDAVFDWLHRQGLIAQPLVEVRTRAALAADNPRLARTFAQELPPLSAAPLLLWAQLLETPGPVLKSLAAHPEQPVEAAALDAGFARLARSDSAAALELLPLLLTRADMTGDLRGRLQRDAALGAAYDRSPYALSALDSVSDDAANDELWQWRVRAALWRGQFDRARAWIERMPAPLAAQPRWRYWSARAVEATQGADAAVSLYASIASLRDYYGYLAADRLHVNYSLNVQASPDDPALQAALAARPGLLRASALFDCNLWDDASAEWANELADADPATRIQAARLAERWGWYAQAIATLAQANEWNDVGLRYPRPFSDEVARASARAQIPADWLMAVMRQESLFRRDAISRVGARGLMQLRVSTASAVARRWQLPTPATDELYDPRVSLTIGAAYLRELMDRYHGQLGPALAAYNAGTSPVARWMPTNPMDADVWIENIAYGETRDYVQRIFEHIVAFAWVRDADPPRLASLLPPVLPTEANASAPPPPPVVAPPIAALH